MNNILRDHALRLAFYLHRLGIDPHVSGASYREYITQLNPLWCSVPAQLRWDARIEGRKVIRETGGVEPAASHLLPEPSLPLQITGQWKKSYEKHLKRMLSWGRIHRPAWSAGSVGFYPSAPGRAVKWQTSRAVFRTILS